MKWRGNLAWQVELSDTVKKQLTRLSRPIQIEILKYLKKRIATPENPRRFGSSLRKNLAGLWRYRVRDYRIICEIQDDKILVLVLRLGHSRKVYA